MSRYLKMFLLVIIPLAIASGVIAYFKPLTRGLDIAGGIRVVMQANPSASDDWPREPNKQLEKMRSIRKTIQERVKGVQGTAEPVVQVQDNDKLVVELPGVRDTDAALNRIRSTASLEFYYLKNVRSEKNPIAAWEITSMPSADGQKAYEFTGPRGEVINSIDQPKELMEKVVGTPTTKPVLTGKDLLPNADTGVNQNNEVVVNIQFNKTGAATFRTFTRNHVGEYLAVFFDGKLMTSPVVRSVIPDGRAEISGFSSLREARQTADYLNAGALPIPLKVIAKDSVQPTLGSETVSKVVLAGLVGLALVIVFMLAYYRLPGAIASIALGLYALFTIAFFKITGATMSLAGIAALIISIGMAVDANVLIFERLKEELRAGKTLRAAIDAGFNRAFTAIFDSNMCTAITCAILLWFGTPSVQSFAFTLLFGVIISMFTAITVTRTILHLLVEWEWAQKPSLYALGTSWIHRSGRTLDVVGNRAYYYAFSAILVLLALTALFTNKYASPMNSWLKPGIEFKSGTTVQASFERPVRLPEVLSVAQEVSDGSQVQLADQGRTAFIKTELLSESEDYDSKIEELQSKMHEEFGLTTKHPTSGKPVFDSVNSVGPAISEELTRNSIIAVIVASLLIVLYIAFRFAIGGVAAGFKYGVCAVIALVHDAIVILGLFAILGRFLGWEVDSLFVTAILTIIGFSVHDTIVVFDRIRENLRHRQRGEGYAELVNRSILQTFSRSINTSMTVVLTVGALIAFGGPLLRHFYIALLVGIVVGTYSSIFNASQLVVDWERVASKTKEPRRKAFEDKPMVSRPMVEGGDEPLAPGEGEVADTAADAVDTGGVQRQVTRPSSGRVKRKKKRF